MRNFQILYFILLLGIISCQPAGTSERIGDGIKPSGKFLNQAIIDACPSKMPVDIPHFVMEMNFRDNDTVVHLNNGFENFALPFTQLKKENTYRITAATLHGDMDFTMLSDSSLILMDTAWTKQPNGTTFSKSTAVQDDGIEQRLNECLVVGTYSIYKDGKKQSGRVDILPNGQINGLHPKIGYKICYAGDCLEDTEPYSSTIHFIGADGKNQVYSFKVLDDKRVLQFYPVSPPPPDQKGGGLIGPIEFELLSEM